MAVLLALPSLVMAGITLQDRGAMQLVARGPIQEGHAKVSCDGCHVKSPGTSRQQIQAKVYHLLGQRESGGDFGYGPVTSDQCLECHARPNERHPIYRFREPRFLDAIKEVDAQSCLGCHSEHTGDRVEVVGTFCSSCHSELTLKVEVIDISHEILVSRDDWGSCLGCHDFHGNQVHQVPVLMGNAFSPKQVQAYLDDGANPYGDEKKYKAKEE